MDAWYIKASSSQSWRLGHRITLLACDAAGAHDHISESPFFSLPPDIRRLRDVVAEQGWDEAWKQNLTPWEDPDVYDVQPALRELINSSRLQLPTTGKALVPGCGRGYDVIHIASSLGLETLGTDISSQAIQAAKERLASVPSAQASGKVFFQEADFFSMTFSENERFDLVYDYTFFVAIPPSRRSEWGRQMTALTKPGAYLITLAFLLGLDPNGGGPPFFMTPEHYHEALTGWTKVLDEVPIGSSPTHKNKERIIVWRKSDT